VKEEDLEFFCKVFGETCAVDFPDGRNNLRLVDAPGAKTFTELFAGKPDCLYEWLDECVRLNFEGVIAKQKGVLDKLMAEAARLQTDAKQ
jgi:hypothetical protein